jgi:hypothetical protein
VGAGKSCIISTKDFVEDYIQPSLGALKTRR